MQQLRTCRLWLAHVLLLVFLFQQSGCLYYQRYPLAKSRLAKIPLENLSFYVIDSAHPLTKMWYVSDFKFEPKVMHCHLTKMAEVEAMEISMVRNRQDAKNSRNEVLLFAKPQFAMTLADTATMTINYEQFDKIEVYEINHGKTVGVVLASVGVAFLAISLVALLTKSSCPFVYAENPDGALFQGELYSGAVYPQLERHDWLPMPGLLPREGEYQVRLANRAREIQHTNVLELLVVDHAPGTEVLWDKNGAVQTIRQPFEPVQAVDLQGVDKKSHIVRTDSLAFVGNTENPRHDALEGLVLTFDKPAEAQHAKLVIRAKNSFWMDYMYGLFLDEFGEYSPEIRQRYLKKSKEDIREWIFEQQIPLQVAIESKDGKWTPVDYFNLSGPMALKKDVVALDLSAFPGDQLRVRLTSGFQFWEIDYVAVDYTENERVAIQTLSPLSAIGQNGEDRTAALRNDDGLYYSQPNIGDEALIRYAMPMQAPGTQRSLLLHAKGHYEILREPVEGKPNLLYLQQFSRPGALPKYSRERWHELMRPEVLTES